MGCPVSDSGGRSQVRRNNGPKEQSRTSERQPKRDQFMPPVRRFFRRRSGDRLQQIAMRASEGVVREAAIQREGQWTFVGGLCRRKVKAATAVTSKRGSHSSNTRPSGTVQIHSGVENVAVGTRRPPPSRPLGSPMTHGAPAPLCCPSSAYDSPGVAPFDPLQGSKCPS